jgi:arginase/agmatinase
MVRDIIRHVAGRAIGFDLVEVCPPVDNGNTSALAARLIKDFIAGREKGLQ